MAVNAFITFFDAAEGESNQKGKEKWIEVQGWDWEIQAESSWTKGGGASVGKPSPGKLSFEYYYDKSSGTINKFMCTGKAFPKAELNMMKTTGKGSPETYFAMKMEGCFITRSSMSGKEEGNVTQKVELVFKTVQIDYKPQSAKDGTLAGSNIFKWDIPAGVAE